MSEQGEQIEGSVGQATVNAENPWPGLIPFGEADEAYFRGRSQETDSLLRLVLRQRLSVLFGLSGLGKSSLLLAGLFPRLRKDNVFPVYMRLDFSTSTLDLNQQVKDTLLREASKARIETPLFQAGESLWEYFHRTKSQFWDTRNKPVIPLLVFDQFEEVFTLGQSDVARRQAVESFLDQLADLAEGRPPASVRTKMNDHPEEVDDFCFDRHNYKILLSVREDFLPELEGLRKRMGDVAVNRRRLQRMKGHEALQVVNQASHLIDTDVSYRVVRFVAADKNLLPLEELEIEPALLSVVCRELNSKRQQQGEQKITADLLEGTQDEVLSDFYERSIGDLGPEVRTFVEDRLLTKSGYRNSEALENAEAAVGRSALDQLVARRLLRIEERGGTQRIEVTHDRLTEVIRTSRDKRKDVEEKRQAERVVRKAQEQREEAQRNEARALRDLRVSRIRSLFLAAIAAAAIGASLYAYYLRERATQAIVMRLCADAESAVAAGQTSRGLALAARALRLDPSSTYAEGWIVNIIRTKPDFSIFLEHGESFSISPDGSRIWTMRKSISGEEWNLWNIAERNQVGNSFIQYFNNPGPMFSPDGRQTLIVSQNVAKIVNIDSGTVVGQPMIQETDIDWAKFSPDGGHVLTATLGHKAQVWDAKTGEAYGEPMVSQDLDVAEYGPSGNRILTQSLLEEQPRTSRLWDPRTGKSVGEPMDNNISFSPDGRRLFTISSDWSTAQLWDAERGKRLGKSMHSTDNFIVGTFSHNGYWLCIQYSQSSEFRRAETGELVSKVSGPMRSSFVKFSEDGRRVLRSWYIAGDNKMQKYWIQNQVSP